MTQYHDCALTLSAVATTNKVMRPPSCSSKAAPQSSSHITGANAVCTLARCDCIHVIASSSRPSFCASTNQLYIGFICACVYAVLNSTDIITLACGDSRGRTHWHLFDIGALEKDASHHPHAHKAHGSNIIVLEIVLDQKMKL
jgi:hypothetical protein